MAKKKQLLLLVILLAVGILGAFILIKTKPQAKLAKPKRVLPSVEVLIAKPTNHDIKIMASGKIIPAQKANLSSEVSGRVIWKSSDLVQGARVKKDQKLLQIDESSYKLNLERQKAQVAQAKLALKLEEAQQKIAKKDLVRLKQNKNLENGLGLNATNLALRKPHLAQAKANLAAAKSALAQARLNVGKTTIRAPFNAIVSNEQIDLGSFVGPQTPLASLIGTQNLWAKVSLPISELQDVQVGDKAKVILNLSNRLTLQQPGKILRILGELDKLGHMAQVILNISNPFTTETQAFLPGANIKAEISGKELKNIFKIPRQAIYKIENYNFVWVLEKNKIKSQQVNILMRNRDSVFVDTGVTRGQKIVISALRAPFDDMRVKGIK